MRPTGEARRQRAHTPTRRNHVLRELFASAVQIALHRADREPRRFGDVFVLELAVVPQAHQLPILGTQPRDRLLERSRELGALGEANRAIVSDPASLTAIGPDEDPRR